ncbi:MAG: TerB family tellurite resistance protein [Sandaracinaceae bacterium]|nr:TerB family tellurite resistance protein [Sandaracinaceae bacterium]MDW8245417.1 TerB family tellurite resistance protein [Sandaracinaceae bacterium]
MKSPTKLSDLDSEERLRLMKFVCAFAWADLKVADAERSFVRRLFRRLALGPEEEAKIEEWLEVPPPPEEVDPNDVPRAHRQLFLKVMRELVQADGTVSEEERELLQLLEQLLA